MTNAEMAEQLGKEIETLEAREKEITAELKQIAVDKKAKKAAKIILEGRYPSGGKKPAKKAPEPKEE